MSLSQPADKGAPRRHTSIVLTAGVVVAGVLFAVAVALELLGAEPGDGEMTDLGAVLEGVLGLTPWAWATLGAYAVLATPVLGLVVTAGEYWRVSDYRTMWLALSVIAVLAVSAIVAVLR